MKIKTFLVKDLTPQQQSDMMSIYSLMEVVSLEQYPGFAQASEPEIPVLYLLAYRQDKLIGYACVKIKKSVLATVSFGPLVRDADDYEEVCAATVNACTYKGVLMMKIFPPFSSVKNTPIQLPFAKLKSEQSDEDFNWASLLLPLDRPMEEIFSGFSENHKRSIRKAQKINLSTAEITTEEEINLFAEQYTKMYKIRELPVDLDEAKLSFQRLFTFFKEQKTGIFLAVKSDKGGMIGGLCISYQGNAAFYHKGYSHPDFRQLPINHLAFYDAINLAKAKGLKYFDFGGYGLNLSPEDQVNGINRFKDGFGGHLVTYPQTLTIYTTPISKLMHSIYQKFRK